MLRPGSARIGAWRVGRYQEPIDRTADSAVKGARMNRLPTGPLPCWISGTDQSQATCNACSTFSFSKACFTTSIISVT